MKYRIKDGYNVRQIAGTWVAVPTGSRAKDRSTIITLNDTAVFLWNLLAKGIEFDGVVTSITEEYNIDNETAKIQTEKFIDYLKERHLIEE